MLKSLNTLSISLTFFSILSTAFPALVSRFSAIFSCLLYALNVSCGISFSVICILKYLPKIVNALYNGLLDSRHIHDYPLSIPAYSHLQIDPFLFGLIQAFVFHFCFTSCCNFRGITGINMLCYIKRAG